MPKNDILFLTILFPKNGTIYSKYVKRNRAQNISAIQYALLEGITAIHDSQCTVLNTLLVPTFPQGHILPIVTGSKFDIEGIGDAYSYPFINLRGLYASSLFWGAKKHLKKWALSNSESGKNKIALAYSLTTYTLQAMRYLKTINPDIKTAIIVPDLPQYTYQKSSSVIRSFHNELAKRKVRRDIEKMWDYVDGGILFSEKMTEELDCKNHYMVFEGIASEQFFNVSGKRLFPDEVKEILYAGGLSEAYGVKLLLEAFACIEEKSYRLIIAGRGELEKEVIQATERDPRIVYMGEINREELLALEKEADVLVNPRVNSGIFTRYSFPSKNMEFMSSGRPLVGYKLDGIPNTYDQYINYFLEETPNSLADMIVRVCTEERTEAFQRAEKGKEYIMTCKNKEYWGKQIVQFICEC